MKSLYTSDKKLEELFADWLDLHFYEELAKQELILGWYRVNGRKLQKKGKDVVLVVTATEEHIIDEKATLHYINSDIPTFAFELKNQKSGAVGWLFNRELDTEYYLLAWPCAKKTHENKFEFTSSKIMLIKRDNVIELLQEKGLTKRNLLLDIEAYSKIATPRNNKFKLVEGIVLNFNFKLYEKPINLVIKRKLLEQKATIFTNFANGKSSILHNLSF